MTTQDQRDGLGQAPTGATSYTESAAVVAATIAAVDATVTTVTEAEDRWSRVPGLLGLTGKQWAETQAEVDQERAASAATAKAAVRHDG